MRKDEFIKKCKDAREHSIKAEKITNEILDGLSNDCLETLSDAENADTVEDAICCYIQYGEYSPEDIWYEITHRK